MTHLGLFPVSLVAVCFLTFIISYIISVANHDVPALFPYISSTGAKRPESCVFGFFLNITVFLALTTMYIRFKAVQSLSVTAIGDRRLTRLNKAALVAGAISCIGCMIVANFQEGTQVETVHMTGAAITFIVGIAYCFLQSALSYQMYPEFNGKCICKVRLGISVVSLVCAAITTIAAAIAIHQWNDNGHDPDQSKIEWNSGDAGYLSHIVSTTGEWLTAISFFCFFLTFIGDFNKFDMEIKLQPLVFHMDQDIIPVMDANERTRLLGV